MSFNLKITLERHYVEAWGLWWLEWQQWKKERLRRHTMSTQTRLKEFESRHLSYADYRLQLVHPLTS